MYNDIGDRMKEYIDIYDANGNAKKMEIMFTCNNDGKNYIVYKDTDGTLYAAKYNDNVEITDLDTNLSADELNKLNEVYSKIKEGLNDNN